MYKMYVKFVILTLILSFGLEVVSVVPSNNGRPIVHTRMGSVRGLRAKDGNYSMYLSIPYAQVDPDNVFGIAKPYPRFKDIFDASNGWPMCPQPSYSGNSSMWTLECLHINMYVPDSATESNPLAVFVWINGGGYQSDFAGRTTYGPRFLIRHNIILVTLNYRQGPYGFMCLDIPEVPGNQGIRDQAIALKWIKDNIAAFGGDNTKITVGGNSAGAMSTDLHLYYGLEDNLFQRIILQSGVALVPGTVAKSKPSAALELAKHLNHSTNDLKEALSFLAKAEPEQLLVATRELAIPFTPCLEKQNKDIHSFITEFPVNKKVTRVKDIDVLIGLTDDELYADYVNMPDVIFQNMDFVEGWLFNSFDFGNDAKYYTEIHEIVSNFYFGDEEVTSKLKREVTDLGNDFIMNYPAVRTVQKYLDNGVKNMYLYLFSYSGQRNRLASMNMTGGGASHADEEGYLFDVSYIDTPLNPEDQIIVDRMTELWANFVKYGNPTPKRTELIPILWPSVTKEKMRYMNLDKEITVSSRPWHNRMAFLDLLYKMNERYQRGYEMNSGPSSRSNLVLGLSLPVLLIVGYFF